MNIDENILIRISEDAGYRHVGDLWFTNPHYKGGKKKRHMSWTQRHGMWCWYDFYLGHGGSLHRFLREILGRSDLVYDSPPPPKQEKNINIEIEREKLAVEAANEIYQNCEVREHPYLIKKGFLKGSVLKKNMSVPLHKGEKKTFYYSEGTLFTFAQNLYTGAIEGYQYIIYSDGWKKLSQPRSWRTPIFGVLGNTDNHTVVVCEGYATGRSLHQITQLPVIISFGVSRMRAAVFHLQQIDKFKKIIVACDDDPVSLANGVVIANEFANTICVRPRWELVTKRRGDKDFNDLDRRCQEQCVCSQDIFHPFHIKTVEEQRSLIQKIKDGIIRLLL